MRTKAPESLCAGGLSKSKEDAAHRADTLPGGLQTGKTQAHLLCENQGYLPECRLNRKGAKNVCEGCCKTNGKRTE